MGKFLLFIYCVILDDLVSKKNSDRPQFLSSHKNYKIANNVLKNKGLSFIDSWE